MARKSLKQFIEENRLELQSYIKSKTAPDFRVTYEECRLWILNDEGLYSWAKGEGVNI